MDIMRIPKNQTAVQGIPVNRYYSKPEADARFAPIGVSSITLKTNGTTNGSQSILNLKNGTNISITDDGVGGITITSTGGSSSWGSITGTLSSQTDLQNALNAKLSSGYLPEVVFDGLGSVVLVNTIKYFRARNSGTITGWSIVAEGSSPTCTIDIYKIASGTTLPTSSIKEM